MIIPQWHWSLYQSALLAVVLLLTSFGSSILSANVNLDALIDQVNEEQQEDAEAKAAEAERQRRLDAAAEERRRKEIAAAAERRRKAAEDRRRREEAAAERRRKDAEDRRRREEAAAEARRKRLAEAERKRKWEEFTDALYTDIGFSWNPSSTPSNTEFGKVYYGSSTRLYVEFGYKSIFGLGLRLIGTKHDYFIDDSIDSVAVSEDTASTSGQGYGIHLNPLSYLTLGVNKIGLTESLQFDDIDYNPGVITEYVVGLHRDVSKTALFGIKYMYMEQEEVQLSDSSDGFFLWLRYRFGN